MPQFEGQLRWLHWPVQVVEQSEDTELSSSLQIFIGKC